jgi:large subunit ribosomal protein L9
MVLVKVNVARSPDEAEQQAAGVDVIKAMFEDEAAADAATEFEGGGGEFEPEAAAPAAEAPAEDEAAEDEAEG